MNVYATMINFSKSTFSQFFQKFVLSTNMQFHFSNTINYYYIYVFLINYLFE